MPHDTTVPRAKVVEIAENIRELLTTKALQQLTQAELIRWCVRELRADPNNHRMRGHESYREAAEIRKENLENKEKALLYLDWLATQLENNASGTLTDSEPPDAA